MDRRSTGDVPPRRNMTKTTMARMIAPIEAARRKPRAPVPLLWSGSRGARGGPGPARAFRERASRFRADGIGLLSVSEHGPQPRGERVRLWGGRHAQHIGDDSCRLVRASRRLIQHREAGAGAHVLGEGAKLGGERLLRLWVSFEPTERVPGVVVQLAQTRGSRLLQFGDGLLEEGERIGKLPLVVEHAC